MLWCTGSNVTQAELSAAERLAPDFASADACLIHFVVGAMPKDVVPSTDETAFQQLFDPRNEVAPLFGVTDRAILVLDRNRRVAGIFRGGDLNEALALCQAHFDDEPTGTIAVQAPVLLISAIFSAPERASLIEYWTRAEKETSNNVASTILGNNYEAPQIKRRTDVAIQSRPLFELVKTRIQRRVVPELLKAFQFAIDRMEAPRIGCYESAERGEFKRHRDNTTPFTAHRKFALSVNLNDEYDGGEVTFPEYGRRLYKPGAGNGVAFSSSLLHEAQPVTGGRRFGLFTFFTDVEGGKREDEMLAKQGGNLKNYKLT